MINWMYFPRNKQVDELSAKVILAFEQNETQIDSQYHAHDSNTVLSCLCSTFEKTGFIVERGKKAEGKIRIPVLFGRNGKTELAFEADAYCETGKYVIEVEAGRAVTNYQFLKDFFEACTMYDIDYLCIAVRNEYRKRNDFELVCNFFDAMYSSNRLKIPLKGLLIIGY